MFDSLLKRHTISVLVDDEFGVLSRVLSVFTSRGYNIASLTVSEVDEDKNLSRITIITNASAKAINQIITLLERLVPVHKVIDLTSSGSLVEREVGLIKIKNSGGDFDEIIKLAKNFGAKLIDSENENYIFEISDEPAVINNFISTLKNQSFIQLIELVRTGITAIGKGDSVLSLSSL
jgi:acetolactate synthase-1/3 small subunit